MRCFSAIWWNENEGWRWTTCRVFLRVCLCLIGDLKHSHDKSLLLSHTTFTQSSCHGFLSESIWHPGMFPLNTVLFDWIKEAGWLTDCSMQIVILRTCFMLSLCVLPSYKMFYDHGTGQKKVCLTGSRLPCWLLCEHWHFNFSPQTLVHV